MDFVWRAEKSLRRAPKSDVSDGKLLLLRKLTGAEVARVEKVVLSAEVQ